LDSEKVAKVAIIDSHKKEIQEKVATFTSAYISELWFMFPTSIVHIILYNFRCL